MRWKEIAAKLPKKKNNNNIRHFLPKWIFFFLFLKTDTSNLNWKKNVAFIDKLYIFLIKTYRKIRLFPKKKKKYGFDGLIHSDFVKPSLGRNVSAQEVREDVTGE